jgi:hypothetical protein
MLGSLISLAIYHVTTVRLMRASLLASAFLAEI